MHAQHAKGRNASALKYDILTALLAYGLHEDGAGARLAPRLAVLITARFNWQTGNLTVGQREIARLWGVTERTAKREVALMRARGWLFVRRPATRGRVTEHGIDIGRVLADSRGVWEAIGPDFVARMSEPSDAPVDNVVPLGRPGQAPAADGTLWAEASRRLWEEDPSVHAAWLSKLTEASRDGPRITLAAPSAFVATYITTHLGPRLLAAFAGCDAGVREVHVVAS